MHRRTYLPNGKLTYYDALRLRSLAARFERARAADVVNLIHQAKVSRAGTDAHVQIQGALRNYARSLGWPRGTWLRITVAYARFMRWVRGESSYQPSARKAA
jgi:hypothetical protein